MRYEGIFQAADVFYPTDLPGGTRVYVRHRSRSHLPCPESQVLIWNSVVFLYVLSGVVLQPRSQQLECVCSDGHEWYSRLRVEGS